ncbi:unnamed protein product [Brassicogethes aeneus]|uniref:Sulfide:quinone oxidoreductase, mitochondrial n=1 Tax=Brassicogethes aeneus TaxID=1431903 RepID=A0A9P0AXP2_BRAAE|nr:unnamed protein product [Brassicogethes aeneus]
MNSKFLYRKVLPLTRRTFSINSIINHNHSCKLLVVGGGTGGCSVAAKFAKKLKKNELFVLEPSEHHYYQPLFTLIGAGVGTVKGARRNEIEVLPENCTWLKDNAVEFDLKNNQVKTSKGDTIQYEFLLVAVGLETRYDKIPGLLEALSLPSGVCSNYSAKYVNKTYEVLQNLKDGNAIFTFPNSPVKCPGAPQKICYLTEHYLRKKGIRKDVKITYNTSLGVIFGVKTYADALWKICKERGINVNLKTNLKEIDVFNKEATFENLNIPEELTKVKFSMLHVTPPMCTPEVVGNNKELSNAEGFVEVEKNTLQHCRYKNVFAIGDCSSTPNSKTAAAAAAQSNVVYHNLSAVMNGSNLSLAYDGYASCPLITGYNSCILAEFDYNLSPLETFPFRQDRELLSMYLLKKNFMPSLYWHFMLKGNWNGPATFRKLMHFDFK